MSGVVAGPRSRDRLDAHTVDTWLADELSLVTVQESHAAVVAALARPEKCNALSLELIRDLDILVERLQLSGMSKPFVLRGAGKWFASGGDLRQFSTFTSDQAVEMARLMSRVLRGIESLPGPTIAALNGPAIGGGIELALAFDMRVASASAYLRFAQTRIGIVTGWQGVERLCRLVGYSNSLYLLLAAKEISAVEALQLGLVNAVWGAETFDADLETFTQSVRKSAMTGLAIKRILRESAVRPGLSTGELECELLRTLWDRPERLAAMTNALAPRGASGSQSSSTQAPIPEKSGLHPIEDRKSAEYTAPRVRVTSAAVIDTSAPRLPADDVSGGETLAVERVYRRSSRS